MIQELATIRDDLSSDRPVQSVTVRTFLSWFDAQRRGYWIVEKIKQQLQEAGVRTEPDFESAWIDTPIAFLPERAERQPDNVTADAPVIVAETAVSDAVGAANLPGWISRDPTYKVSKLHAANQRIVSITPDGTISQVVTLMMTGGFSQLPVMTNEREVKGIITWRSIGSRLAMGAGSINARDFMEPHQEIRSDTSIFNAIPLIVANDYVLVRGTDNKIQGIITANDLSIQFRVLTEPFLLLSEIENLIRNMIGGHFSASELSDARDPGSTARPIQNVADLTFGEYIRLLQNPDRWTQLGIAVDRTIFCAKLDRVREIRNDVTHFDPDGITAQDLEVLRDFTTFLKQLENIVGRASS
jgi:predicted transcriptional regulator